MRFETSGIGYRFFWVILLKFQKPLECHAGGCDFGQDIEVDAGEVAAAFPSCADMSLQM